MKNMDLETGKTKVQTKKNEQCSCFLSFEEEGVVP